MYLFNRTPEITVLAVSFIGMHNLIRRLGTDADTLRENFSQNALHTGWHTGSSPMHGAHSIKQLLCQVTDVGC